MPPIIMPLSTDDGWSRRPSNSVVTGYWRLTRRHDTLPQEGSFCVERDSRFVLSKRHVVTHESATTPSPPTPRGRPSSRWALINKLFLEYREHQSPDKLSELLSELVRNVSCYREMATVANGVLHDSNLAEEVVQDSLVIFTKKYRTIQGASLRAWLWAVIHNRAIDRRRKNQSRPDRVARDNLPVCPSGSDTERDAIEQLTGERDIGDEEHQRKIARLRQTMYRHEQGVPVKSMTAQERQDLCLGFMAEYGMDHTQISQVTGILTGTIKTNIKRARDRLNPDRTPLRTPKTGTGDAMSDKSEK